MASQSPSGAKRHATVERIRIAGAESHLAPFALLKYAEDFLEAAECLPRTDRPFSPVRCYLACRPIELALKAFLCARGQSLLDLAGPGMGHNLAALLTSAEEAGLMAHVDFSARQLLEVRRASTYYNEKVFEYPSIAEATNGYPQKPDVAVLIAASRTLVGSLAPLCDTI